jgi:hypothetical protein
VRGVGARAAARDGALSRKKKRARLSHHLRRESHHPWPVRHGITRSFTLSVHVPHIPCESRPGPVSPARRRCALEDVKKVLTDWTTSVVEILGREVSSGQAAMTGRGRRQERGNMCLRFHLMLYT